VAKTIGLPINTVISSSFEFQGSSSQKLISIVKHFGGTRYLTGYGAANYLDHEAFEREGIAVEYMNYALSPYQQFHGDFTPYVTILDLIAHVGADAGSFLRSGTQSWRMFL